MRIYLSGPMTGIEDLNRVEFAKYEKLLSSHGHEVINPHKVGESIAKIEDGAEISYNTYMRHDIRELAICDIVALLPGYWNSKGCSIEIKVADLLHIQVKLVQEILWI